MNEYSVHSLQSLDFSTYVPALDSLMFGCTRQSLARDKGNDVHFVHVSDLIYNSKFLNLFSTKLDR